MKNLLLEANFIPMKMENGGPKKSVHIRLKNLAYYINSDHYSLLKFSNRAL